MIKIRIFFTYNDEFAKNCIIAALKEVFSAEIEDYIVRISLQKAYDSKRNQFDAIKIIEENKRLESQLYYSLIVFDQDIFISYLNYIFGLAMGKIAIISTFRLRHKADLNTYCLRCKKEAVHELGHLIGLNHCSNSKCVMFFSHSIIDTDNKDYKFCEKCCKKIEVELR
jgi:Predicted Zn-dependent proteases